MRQTSIGILLLALMGAAVFGQVTVISFTDRAAVMKRFDIDTAAAVTSLEEAAADIQQALDPEAKTLNVLAAIEAKVLTLSATEKIDRAKAAIDTLKQAGIAANSDEVKAINQKLFGQDTVPDVSVAAADNP